jgi:hypothetical protein
MKLFKCLTRLDYSPRGETPYLNVLINLVYICICLAILLRWAKTPHNEVRIHCKQDPIYIIPRNETEWPRSQFQHSQICDKFIVTRISPSTEFCRTK